MVHWYDRMVRVVQLGIEDRLAARLADFDVESFLDDLLRHQVDVLVLQVQNPFGVVVFNSTYLPKQPSLGDRDLLARFADGCRARKVRLVAMVGPTENQHIGQVHGDWAQVSARGKIPVSGTLHVAKETPAWPFLCISSPYRKLVIGVIDEILQYGVDGIFVDFLAQWDCRCTHCANAFRSQYGLELPSSPSDAGWRMFRAFQSGLVTSFAAEVRANVKTHDPDTAVVFYAFPFATRSFVEVADVAAYADVLRIDVHASARQEAPSWIGEMVNLTRAESQKPIWAAVPSSYNWFIGTSKPLTMLRQELRQAVAQGASPCIVTFDWAYLREEHLVRTLVDALPSSEAESRQSACLLRHVGIVTSRATRDLLWEHPEAHGDAVRGWYTLLSAEHIPVELLNGTQIATGKLEDFSALILPNVLALSQAQLHQLRTYVDEGGGLVASYGTGLYDEEGRARSDFALADVLGLHHVGEWQQPWSYIQVDHMPDGCAPLQQLEFPVIHGDISTPFATLVDEKLQPGLDTWADMASEQIAWAFDRVGLRRLAPLLGLTAETGWQQQVVLDGATAWAYAVDTLEPYGSSYIPGITPPIPGRRTDYPVLTSHGFGRGRTVYSAGQLERLFWRTGLEAYRQLLLATLRWVAREAPEITAEAPPTVAITGWRVAMGSKIQVGIDLINHTYEQLSPSPALVAVSPPLWYASRGVSRPAGVAIPVGPIAVTLRLPSDQIRARVVCSGASAFSWEQSGNGLHLVLPRLDEHALLTVTLEQQAPERKPYES